MGARLEEAPPIVHQVLRSPGIPLEASTRGMMEVRFGYNFRDVRVHADSRAAESARAVNANAYTVGRDIVFAAGRYVPSGLDRGLLAHELTHVAQQDGLTVDRPLRLGNAGDRPELEAHRASSARSRAEMPTSLSRVRGLVQRQQDQPKSQPAGANAGQAPAAGASGSGAGGSLCAEHPDEGYYQKNPLYCMDSKDSGMLHAGFRCYREMPSSTGLSCPPGKHVCFDSSGHCSPEQSHIDNTAPGLTKDSSNICSVKSASLCTVEHMLLDVVPGLLAEGEKSKAKCIETCNSQPIYLRGFCMQGCTGGAF